VVCLVFLKPGDGDFDFLGPDCLEGEIEADFDDCKEAEDRGWRLKDGRTGGDWEGDLEDFLDRTAWPVMTRSVLLTDLIPLQPKTGVFLGTVVGA